MNDPVSKPHLESVEPDADRADARHDLERRQALLRMSRYAAAVAPAMLVLMSGKSRALPDCDSPAWKVGLTKAGHSGC